MTRTNFDSLIRNAYYGPKHAGSFSSPIKLYQALRKKGGKTPSLYRIRKWMEKNDNYKDKRDQDSSHQKKKLTVISPAQQVVEQAKLTLQRQNRPVYKRRKLVKKINRRQRTEQKRRKKSKIGKTKVKKTKAKGKKKRKTTYTDIFD